MSDTPEMVERVARAIQESAEEYRMRPFIDGWDKDYVRMASERFARAAIKAMLDPTELMVERGAASLDEICHNDYSDGYRAQYVWIAMCRKALGQ